MVIIDLRQVMAAILTFSMFIMLGNMIKRDHIDPLFYLLKETVQPRASDNKFIVSKATDVRLVEESYGPWQEHYKPAKHCWKKPAIKGKDQSNGYIFFSLTHGPEFHASQVANVVEVARRLGATLALPDIKGIRFGEKKSFGDVYDVNNFVTNLKGVVRVDKNPPIELSNSSLPIVRIPESVSEDLIDSEIVPIFRVKRNLRIVTSFDSSPRTKAKENNLASSYRCTAMFESLKLQVELQELVDSTVGSLRSLSQKSKGRFVAVDLRAEMMQKKACQEADAPSKRCYDGNEMAEFLTRIGFKEQVIVYLTQTGWQGDFLKEFRNAFPNTFTKDVIMPAYAKAKLLNSEIPEYERFIDFHICSQGDVFVPAVMGRFYASVVGQRVASGRTQVFVPAKKVGASNDSADDYLSLYIQKKNHDAHSCFC
ncbi:protein MANNAN SYNTHESIS-RELATED 1-like isoform X1 [Primulina huaijiensis]|uniref:protein MANNAN SYNTHESIS-RELATED 1-like isoform X1 n=1 Tax=Primulina huaijiensis TaxID=1492673 RepID=UPI003CC6DD61